MHAHIKWLQYYIYFNIETIEIFIKQLTKSIYISDSQNKEYICIGEKFNERIITIFQAMYNTISAEEY